MILNAYVNPQKDVNCDLSVFQKDFMIFYVSIVWGIASYQMLGLSPYRTFIAHVPYPRTTPNEGLRRPANFHHVEHRDGKTKMRFKIVCCILGKAHIGKSTYALLANQVHLYMCSYIHIFYIQMVRFNSYANLPNGTFCYLSVSSSQWKWLEFMDLVKETSQWPAWKSYKIMKTEAIWRYPWPPYFRHIFGWFWTVQWWFWMTSKRALSQLFQARVFEPKHVGRISSLTHVWSYKFSYWHKIHKSQTLPNSVDCSSCFLSNSMHICTMQCPQPGTFPRNQIQVLVLNSTRNSSSACLKAK